MSALSGGGGGAGDSGCSCEGCDYYNAESKIDCSSPDECECVCHGFKASDSIFKDLNEVSQWWYSNCQEYQSRETTNSYVAIFSKAGLLVMKGLTRLTNEEVDKVASMPTTREMVMYLSKKSWALTAMDTQKNILYTNSKDGVCPFLVKRFKEDFDRLASAFADSLAKAEAKAAQAAADAASIQRQFKEAKDARLAREAEVAQKAAKAAAYAASPEGKAAVAKAAEERAAEEAETERKRQESLAADLQRKADAERADKAEKMRKAQAKKAAKAAAAPMVGGGGSAALAAEAAAAPAAAGRHAGGRRPREDDDAAGGGGGGKRRHK